MQKVSVELSPQQAEQLLEQLSPAVKIQLVRRWEQETWPKRLQQLLQRVDQRWKRHPQLAQRALRDIAPARRAFYAARGRRR